MFCVECGFKNPEGSRFCARCGGALPSLDGDGSAEGLAGRLGGVADIASEKCIADEVPVRVPEFEVIPTDLRPVLPEWLRGLLRSGWEPAWWGALTAAGVMFGLGTVLAVLMRFAAWDGWDAVVARTLSVVKAAGLFTFVLARVPIRFEGSFDLFVAQGGGTVTAVVVVLGGFMLMAWLLIGAGRRTAESSGAHELREFLVQGAKVGVWFGLILFVTSFVFTTSTDTLTFGPSHSGALGVGLLWGVVFGAVGGLKATRRKSLLALVAESVPVRFRIWVSATQGAMRGVALAVGLATVLTVVLLVLATLDNGFPDTDNLAGVATIVLGGLLFLPTVIVNGLMFAHGVTLQADAALTGLSRYAAGFSLFDFPRGFGLSGDLAPWYMFLAVLIPLIAVVTAGETAAAQQRVRTTDDARRVGILVGIPYALMLWVLAVVARSTIDVSSGGFFSAEGTSTGGQLMFGVSLGGAFLLTLVWGSVGGMVGARYYLSRLPAAKRPSSGTHRVQPSPQPIVDPTGAAGVIHCTECGSALPGDSRFCFSCGADQTSG